jgi:hypothetical protein
LRFYPVVSGAALGLYRQKGLPGRGDGRLDGAAGEHAIDEDDDGFAIALVEPLQALELVEQSDSLISSSAPVGSWPSKSSSVETLRIAASCTHVSIE